LQPLLQPWAPLTTCSTQPAVEDCEISSTTVSADISPVTIQGSSETKSSDDTTEMPVRNGAQAPIFGLPTSDETLWDDDFYDMDEDDGIDNNSFFDEPFDDVFLQDDSDSFSEDSEDLTMPRPQARETWKTSTKRT
jgi:hypothetical protein